MDINYIDPAKWITEGKNMPQSYYLRGLQLVLIEIIFIINEMCL